MRKKKRKELQRLRNRLNELGEIAVREATPTDDITAWTEEFLLLEDKGWKGKKRTSLKSSERDAEWFGLVGGICARIERSRSECVHSTTRHHCEREILTVLQYSLTPVALQRK